MPNTPILPVEKNQKNAEPSGSTEIFVAVDKIKNGIIYLKGGGLRKVIMTTGINLDLQSEDDQNGVFVGFQNLINSLEFSIQMNVHSRRLAIQDYLDNMHAREQEETDPFIKSQLHEYTSFITDFVAENAIVEKSFFIAVPIDYIQFSQLSPFSKTAAKDANKNDKEPDGEELASYLEKLNFRTEQILGGLRALNLRAVILNDDELIEYCRNFYNPKTVEKGFVPSDTPIAPQSLEVSSDHLKINGKYAKSFYILDYPRYLSAGWLEPIINLPELFDISLYIKPVDTTIALKNLSRKVTSVTAQMMEREEKGLIRDPELETALKDTEELRDTLQQTREKLFSVGLYFTIYADTPEGLRSLEYRITTIFDRALVTVKPPLFEQIEALSTVIPLVKDAMDVGVTMNTSPASSFFPFISPDLTSDEGILYGVNLHNNTLIIFDRFKLENHNSVIFAKSGSGKSYTAKLELLRTMMIGSDVLIIDPENEYQTLAEAMDGSIFKISLSSKDNINPFDIPPIPEGEDVSEILQSHVANLSGLIKIMVGAMTPSEEGILDRAINETYASRDIVPGKDISSKEPPLLEDLEVILKSMEGGKDLADRLYRFTKGSYAGFANRKTNIDVKNRVVVFSIRDLEEELRPVAMYMILNFVWNIVRSALKKRILVVDEAWIMMKYPDSASFLFNLVRRARKYYLGITTITQDVEDFLNSPYGRPVITNSSLQILLKQSSATIDTVGKAFNLTAVEKDFLINASVGQGLILVGQKHVAAQIISSPFENQIITTNPEEILAMRDKFRESTESTPNIEAEATETENI